MNKDKDKISCAILVYNNEPFIKEAVLNVLGQTYPHLEIIISDDNSTDSSFRIIEDLVSNYSGPHSIILNKNAKNLGICGHVNKIVSLASADYFVIFAGDDVSQPNRVETIYNHIVNTDIKFLTTDCYVLSGEERSDKLLRSKNIDTENIIKFLWEPDITGATEAFSRDLFEIFGNLREDNYIEDNALAFRGFLLKKVSYIYEPTIYYRVHNSNLSSRDLHSADKKGLKKHFDQWYPAKEKLYQQHNADLEIAYQKQIITRTEYLEIKRTIDKLITRNTLSYQLDLYWLKALKNYNIIKLCLNAVKVGLPIKFIVWRLIKRIKTSYSS